MMNMPFQKLQIWQKGLRLVKDLYDLTRTFPKEELYGLTSQMRRAAVSIPANIAEGSQRTSEKEFAHFVLMAKGSLAELDTFIYIASEMHYITKAQANTMIASIEELDRTIRSFHLQLTA